MAEFEAIETPVKIVEKKAKDVLYGDILLVAKSPAFPGREIGWTVKRVLRLSSAVTFELAFGNRTRSIFFKHGDIVKIHERNPPF